MPKMCRFHLCPSRSKKHPQKKFYPFIKPWMDRDKCLRWIAASGRKDLTTVFIDKSCYVCEDHFVNGAPSAENPDPLPVYFSVLASRFNPPVKHTGENPILRGDQDEAAIDDPSELCSDTKPGPQGDNVASACCAPSTEDPELLQYHFLARIDDSCENACDPVDHSCLANTTPQAKPSALPHKKKTISSRKTSGLSQELNRVPVSISEDDECSVGTQTCSRGDVKKVIAAGKVSK